MLAGEPPFAAATRQAAVQRLMHEPPPTLFARRPDVAPFIAAAVRHALAKRPEQRFASAAAFAAALLPLTPSEERVALGPARSGPLPPHGRTVSASTALYVAAVMLVVGLAGGLLLDPSSLIRRWTDASAAAAPSAPGRELPIVAPADVSRAADENLSLAVVDRTGRPLRTISATRPWTPRFSPDGHRVAYGAFGAGRQTSDLWVTDLDAGKTQRLTDDDGDANDPQWSADGTTIAYSVSAPGGKDVVMRLFKGGRERVLASRDGTQFPSDWLRDGSALLVTDDAGGVGHDILVQSADGSPAKQYVATGADETAARISPDERWVAYTSNESGESEVYLAAYPNPGRRVKVSAGGGVHPVWRSDGRELYYWRDGALVAVPLGPSLPGAPPPRGHETVLFRAPYFVGLNTMYDVSPDGKRFVIVEQRSVR
jgi:serine/threonine-protein kinase